MKVTSINTFGVNIFLLDFALGEKFPMKTSVFCLFVCGPMYGADMDCQTFARRILYTLPPKNNPPQTNHEEVEMPAL